MWPQANEYVIERVARERNVQDRRSAQQHRLLADHPRIERDPHAPSTTMRLRDLLQQIAARLTSARI